MSQHVMIDLETLGSAKDSVILSVGAVKFNPHTFETLDTDSFHVAVDPQSCQMLGLKIDASTVMWWLHKDRDDARRDLLEHDQVDLPSTLEGFRMWYGSESLPTWSNGATFDLPIMENAFAVCGFACPWKFWHQRCYRTMKNLKPDIPMPNVGTVHNALHDAMAQVQHLKLIVKALGIGLAI